MILFSRVGYYFVSVMQQHLAKEAMEHVILANIPDGSFMTGDYITGDMVKASVPEKHDFASTIKINTPPPKFNT